MKPNGVITLAVILLGARVSAAPQDAPVLPMGGARVVNVSTEAQLQGAMRNLRDGDTILLAAGTYNLSASLYVNGRNDVTIRGNGGSTNVVLVGKGMDNANHGGVPFGIWSNGGIRRLRILRFETLTTTRSFSILPRSRRMYML